MAIKVSLIFSIILFFFESTFAQSDTIIDSNKYQIISTYKNGAIKRVGQFGTNCLGKTNRKHGCFIKYNKLGKETMQLTFFYDRKMDKRFLWLKYGWWGFGTMQRYFLGIKIGKSRSYSPCF